MRTFRILTLAALGVLTGLAIGKGTDWSHVMSTVQSWLGKS